MSKTKKRTLIIAGAIALIVATVIICYFVFAKNNETDLLYEDNATTGIMPGTDIDKRKEELQTMLDNSMIAFSINTSPVFLMVHLKETS